MEALPSPRAQTAGDELAHRLRLRLAAMVLLANLGGGIVVWALLGVLLPYTGGVLHFDPFIAIVAAYVAVAIPGGMWWWERRGAALWRWLREERDPDPRERELALQEPMRAVVIAGTLWGVAAVLFGALQGAESGSLHEALDVVVTTALGGLTTCAVTYLVSEWILRPLTARALVAGPPSEPVGPGVGSRLVIGWALVTGVPLLGVAVLAASTLAGDPHDIDELAGGALVLAGGAFAAGLLATVAAARSLARSVGSVRGALGRIRAGDLDARVAVDDSGEVGALQVGFNEMAEGLAERERIREAFGTYVDREVAEHVLREGTALEGEEVEVTLLFLDIRGFTSFAERLRAPEVVATLNRLFERIVPVIHAQGGHVDKYVGDGLLAVFGAPRRQPDHADQALAAALEIAAAVEDEFGEELSVGIGLNSGPVVAGSLGGAGRLEFSVIGDAVNVAARVEAATRQTGDRVLVAARTRELLEGVKMRFVERPGLTLKGKTRAVAIYAPVSDSAPAPPPPSGRPSTPAAKRWA
jgi:adenylate cyclase